MDKDQIYKVLIQNFFKEFMELFLPYLAERIDYSSAEFLMQEMFTDLPKGKRKKLDLVVKIKFLGEDEEKIIIIHIEVEGKKQQGIARRMFKYFAQLYLRFEKDIIPIVIFVDDHKWKEDVDREYLISYDEQYLNFRYKKIKLKDLNYKQFLNSKSPLAHALMVKMDFDKKERVRLKAEVLRLILTGQIDEARQSILLNFVEECMVLKLFEEQTFKKLIDEKEDYKEIKHMVTIYEEKGIQKGIQQGAVHLLIQQIIQKFGPISEEIEKKIKSINKLDELDELGIALLDIKSLEEFVAKLDKIK